MPDLKNDRFALAASSRLCVLLPDYATYLGEQQPWRVGCECITSWNGAACHQVRRQGTYLACVRHAKVDQVNVYPSKKPLFSKRRSLSQRVATTGFLFRVEDNGLEPASTSALPGKELRQSLGSFGTDSGTLQDETGTFSPDLAVVVSAWPHLSDADRKAIIQIVRRAAAEASAGK